MSTAVTSTTTQTTGAADGTGGRLVTADGRTLPLRGVVLRADARGGVASVVLEQRFENPYDEPLRVTYLFPLPADGAVSGYAFSIGDRRVVGEVDRKQQARERFERALAEGRSAGIVEQERSSLFTQELGNVPPHAQVVAELLIDQRLRWLDEGAWEWRFPTAAGPRYAGAAGRVADAARTEIAVADAPLPARLALSLVVRDALPDGRKPESSIHALVARPVPGAAWQVELAEEGGMRLDRDVVIRWAAAAPRVGVSLDAGRPAAARAASRSAYALMTLVPPAPGSAEARPRPRDLILLLDTSGSMGGEPLAQVKKVCAALVDSLGDQDQLELIEFSTAARRWNGKPVHADRKQREKARAWVAGLDAGGGTEMVSGVMEALAPLSAEAQRQVVLLTDGYIGFESEVVGAIAEKLPTGSRLHVVGVGSAVNRSLTGPSARAGRGIEAIVAPGEDVEKVVARLLARTVAPIVTDVEVSGAGLRRAAPRRLPDLYAGAPALAAIEVDPAGGDLLVRGRTAFGAWEQVVRVPACEAGQGSAVAATLFARELVEDLELARAAGGSASQLDAQIEALGLELQIATRLTTWIAVSQDVTVDPSAPSRREIVPQELPHGVSAEGLGLRAPSAAMTGAWKTMAGVAPPSMVMAGMPIGAPASPPGAPRQPTMQAAGPMRALGRGAAGKAVGMAAKVGRLFGSIFERGDDDAGEAEADHDDLSAANELAKDARAMPADAPVARSLREVPAPASEPEAPRPPAKQSSYSLGYVPPRRLRARVRLAGTSELVLEIAIDGDLDWRPDDTAEITFADGTVLTTPVDASRTTRAGRLAAGQVARLTLTHGPHTFGRAVEVSLVIGAERVILEVEPA